MFRVFNQLLMLAVFLLPVTLPAASVQAAEPYRDPYNVVSQVADQLFTRLSDQQEVIRGQPEMLRDIVDEEVFPFVDHRYAAYKVMGTQARGTQRAQRDAFVSEFRTYMVATYAQLFTRYDKNRHSYVMEARKVKNVDDKQFITVRVRLVERGKPDIPVDFRLRKNKKTGEWRAYDMVTEGISFLDSKSSELSGLIRQQGIDAVTVQLAEKSRQPIRFEESKR